MSFATITARLVSILELNTVSLTAGMRDTRLHIAARYPEPGYSAQSLYVFRESLSGLDYGSMSGEGSTSHGEVDGQGVWVIAARVRVPGSDEVAAEELDKLAWNLIKVMMGYTQDSTDAYCSCLLRESRPDYELGPQGQAFLVGERFNLSVRWEYNR